MKSSLKMGFDVNHLYFNRNQRAAGPQMSSPDNGPLHVVSLTFWSYIDDNIEGESNEVSMSQVAVSPTDRRQIDQIKLLGKTPGTKTDCIRHEEKY